MPLKISICIPAYNRPTELGELLESIAREGDGDWEVVISEDCSPQQSQAEVVVAAFRARTPRLPVRFFANRRNLGYDGNLRRLLDEASGDYCLFMGDDDLLAPGGLERVHSAVTRFSEVGFVLRAWRSVVKGTDREIERHRYFRGDRMFPPGTESIAAMYRRAVFISGLAVHREAARAAHTDRFDGTLLYQLYLVGKLVARMPAFYVSDTVAIRRVGGDHFFGNAETERDIFRPGELTPAQSVAFVRGFLEIARFLDLEGGCPGVLGAIVRDLCRYSYPVLEVQASRIPKTDFDKYAANLAALGLGRSPLFHFYRWALHTLGPGPCNAAIRTAKRLVGRTPTLGGPRGRAVR